MTYKNTNNNNSNNNNNNNNNNYNKNNIKNNNKIMLFALTKSYVINYIQQFQYMQ